MKKFILLSFLMISSIFDLNAQLKVNSAGKVGAGVSSVVPQAELSAGIYDGYTYSNYSFAVWARECFNSSFIMGLRGYATSPTANQGRTFGVQGVSGNGTSGWNYGVLGGIGGSNNGAGIFGTTTNHLGVNVYGRYAGYFDGSVRITDTLTVPTIVTPSDIRLKENITSLTKTRDGGVLDRLMDMNVISYNYKTPKYEDADTASVSTTALRQTKEGSPKLRHYGLLAQELRDIYPDLVIEGQDGYLGVNYLELVPLLLRSIQELKAELDEVKGNNDKVRNARATDFDDESTDVSDATKIPSVASLAQNTPNPFTERTTIRFTLPENTRDAYIYIFDMSGKMQKQIPIDSSMQSITIEGYELSAGMYIYSLVIGGKEVKTRRMILSK